MSSEISRNTFDVLICGNSQNETTADNELRIKSVTNEDVDCNLQNSVLKVNEDLKILEISDDVVCVNQCSNVCRKSSECGNNQSLEANGTLDVVNKISTKMVVDTDKSVPEMVTSRGIRTVRRTMSESCSNVTLRKGILKYPRGWRRRTLSESNCDISLTCDEFECGSFSATESIPEFPGCDDASLDEKPKKNVRFSERISKTMFRMNSSILGRKKKNQKRAKRRKGQPKEETNSQKSSVEDISIEKIDDTVNASHTSTETGGDTETVADTRFRQDSGYDSEECSRYDSEGKWCEVISKRSRRRNRNCTE